MVGGKEIEENEMGITCSMNGRVEKRVWNFRQQTWIVITEWKIPRGKYQRRWENTVNWKLEKYVVIVWIGSIWFMIG